MINDGYLIPANTKKGQLIFGYFTPRDLIIFGTGLGVSLILLLTSDLTVTLNAIAALLPVTICGFLVLPIPNYQNVITFFESMIGFYSSQNVYKWKGWCFNEQSKKRK